MVEPKGFAEAIVEAMQMKRVKKADVEPVFNVADGLHQVKLDNYQVCCPSLLTFTV